MLFQFMLHGSFYVNRSLGWDKNERWYDFQETLSKLLDAGVRSLADDRGHEQGHAS